MKLIFTKLSIKRSWHCAWKSLILLLFLLILFSYYTIPQMNVPNRISKSEMDDPICKCFNNSNFNEEIELLDDILASKIQPKFGNSIIFHETSCRNGIISLNFRQACAVESAARTNPTTDVFLLFASPGGFIKDGTKSPMIQALQSYSNVHMRNLNLWLYAKDTPLSAFIGTNKIFQSMYLTSHLSDFLRYVSLFKYGGTYLDLDVVVKSSLDSMKNYAAAETIHSVAAGVMHFDTVGIGKYVASECLIDFEQHFNGSEWGTNGPCVITRVLYRLCKTNNISMMTRDRCNGFRVFEPSFVYAVNYGQWKHFFNEKYTQLVFNLTKDSFVVHVWNKLSASTPVYVGSNVAYELMAKEYCPRVYGSCRYVF